MSDIAINFEYYQGHVSWSPNFFQADILGNLETGSDIGGSSETTFPGEIRFYCSGIDLPKHSLAFKRNPFNKGQMLDKVELKDEITIHWVEDKNMTVQRYHQDWFKRFYDRSTDLFPVGAEGKVRSMIFTVFDPKDMASTLVKFQIDGMVPTSSGPDIKLGWDKYTDSTARISLTYKAQSIFFLTRANNAGDYFYL